MNQFAAIALLSAAFLPFTACNKKTTDEVVPSTSITRTNARGGGSGSGGGGGTTAILQSLVSGGGTRLIATHTDSMLLVFNNPVPASGYTVSVTSSNPSVLQVPATVSVPAGAASKYIVVTSTSISAAANVTVTASIGSESKSAVSKVFPLTYSSFPAPSLQSPGNGSNFGFHRQVIFDWNDNANAWYYELQISPSSSFPTTGLDVFGPQDSIIPLDYFNGTGIRYWRVRFVDASGNGGPWSSVRSFEVKPQ